MNSESLDRLRQTLAQYPRMHGYYLLNMVPLHVGWREAEEGSLSAAFEALDDQTWPPPELRPKDQLCSDYEVDEIKACARVVEALVGGSAVGHSVDTIPRAEAFAMWKRFRDLFSPESRFFLGVGFGDSNYAYQEGAVVVDNQKAGCLIVVEDD